MQMLTLIWFFFCTIMCICGNTFVLLATIRYRAIPFDKMSVWIIQNICVSDLFSVITVQIPVLSSNLARNRWVLGSVVCNIVAITKYTCLIANILFIVSLSLNKLYRCVNPLSVIYCSKRSRISLTIGIYFLISLSEVLMIVLTCAGEL